MFFRYFSAFVSVEAPGLGDEIRCCAGRGMVAGKCFDWAPGECTPGRLVSAVQSSAPNPGEPDASNPLLLVIFGAAMTRRCCREV